LAAESGGSSASVFFKGSDMMIVGIFMAGIVLFSFGVICQIMGLRNAGLIPKPLSIIMVACAVLFMGASAIPSSVGLYVIALLSILIYGMISILFWSSPPD
jgi:hypothetical protein